MDVIDYNLIRYAIQFERVINGVRCNTVAVLGLY